MPQTWQANDLDVKLTILHEAMENILRTLSASVETGSGVNICGKVRNCYPVITSYGCEILEEKYISKVKRGPTPRSCVRCLVSWIDRIPLKNVNGRNGRTIHHK